jgi:hypothetical protein
MAEAGAAGARPSTSIDWWTGGLFAIGSICFAVGKSAAAGLAGGLGVQRGGRPGLGSGGRVQRMFFNRPGTLYQTPQALIVSLDPFSGQEALTPLIDSFNAAGHRLRWFDNLPAVLSLTPQTHPRTGP